MGEFNLMTFEADAPGLRDAARLLQHDIRRYLAEGTVEGRAAAVNEFIAWGLTNQNLIDAMRKTKVRSRLGELALKITRFLKQLLGLPEKTSLDMFSNLRLNAGSLLIDGRRWASDNRIPRTARMLNQLSRLPSDPRIEELMESFNTKIADHLRNRDVIWKDAEEASINRIADQAVNLVAGAGFSLDPQQVSAFRSVQAALASSMEMNRGALTRIQRLFAHVTKQLSVESFMVEPESDRDPWDRQQAQEKFDLVTGKYGTKNDLQGRSNLMATFLALSQVSPEFRRAIRDVELPKDAASIASGSTDERLTNAAESLMNGLATSIAGDRNSRSMLESLDRLTLALAKIEEDDRSQIEKQANSILGTGDAAGRRFLSKTADRLVDFAEGVLAEQSEESSRTRETLAKGARLMAGLIDENRGKALASALVSAGNLSKSVPTTVRELLNEIIGMTDENRAVFSLVNKVRTAVQAARQDHREALPRLFAEKFSRKLDKREWSQLHLGLGRTDIATLAGRMPLDRIRKILRDDKARETEARKLEEKLSSLAPKAARDYLRKADELAEFMVTGRGAKNLLKNADSIAQLFGEDSRQWANPTAETVQAFDELNTLCVIGNLDDPLSSRSACLPGSRQRSQSSRMLVYGILVCNDAIHNEPERTPAHTAEVLMKLSGSFSLAALGAGVLSLAAGPLVAQEDYPSRDIQFVVPFSAGGGSDVVARQIANAINELDLLPVGLIIDNRPGGGGSVGYTYLAAREGDPHYVGTVSIAYFTTPLLGDSPVNHEDFEPIAAIANDPYVMVASNDLGIESLEDVAARDRLVVGSPAAVSDSALLANILGEDLDISMDVIPFDGDGEVLSALLGGHVDIAFSNLSEILPQVEAGEVTAIAVTSADRVEPLPNVPTLQELGHDVRVGNLRGMILPKGVSEEVIAYWEDILQQVANSDYWKENYLDRFSIQAEWMGREEFSKEIVAINDRYEGLMQDLGIIE